MAKTPCSGIVEEQRRNGAADSARRSTPVWSSTRMMAIMNTRSHQHEERVRTRPRRRGFSEPAWLRSLRCAGKQRNALRPHSKCPQECGIRTLASVRVVLTAPPRAQSARWRLPPNWPGRVDPEVAVELLGVSSLQAGGDLGLPTCSASVLPGMSMVMRSPSRTAASGRRRRPADVADEERCCWRSAVGDQRRLLGQAHAG